ncbi:MAG: 2-amino-4-oxopentanoate thiolase subunit OrtA [Bacillota bacterium]
MVKKEKISAGSWVQIYKVVLQPGERDPGIPADTAEVPLEMRINGFLTKSAYIGEECEIETYIGRKHSGTLKKVNPSYEHKYGAPIPELQKIGRSLRTILREEVE